MAEIRISTAGVKVYYAVESSSGVQPTAMSAYTEVAEITAIPGVNETPNTLDATPLSQTTTHVYVDGLRDPGGAIALTANFSQALLTAWNTTIRGAYTTGQASNLNMWFCIVIPGFTQSFYMQGEPDLIGLPAADVDSVYTCQLPIIPTGDMYWAAKPTTT